MAGPALDRFRFPRRDGTALSHLRCQLEDSAKRIHRARAIRRSLHSPVACLCYCSRLHRPARKNQETSVMVVMENEEITRPAPPLELQKPPEPEPRQPVMINVDDVDFCYGMNQVLYDVNLEIPPRAVTALIGPSGCGKTTLLRCFNRMNDLIDGARISAGSIELEGHNIYAPDVDVVELRRRVGMVFQKSNPFPKSIYENVAYGLRVLGATKRSRINIAVEKSLRAAALWDEVKDRLDASAYGLSGGQQQRLCIARALAVEPEVILMDEPCSALDPIATAKVEELIYRLRENYTIVIVTHNMQQAGRCSDLTAFFYLGRLIEFDRTEKIFTNPREKQTEDYITGRFG